MSSPALAHPVVPWRPLVLGLLAVAAGLLTAVTVSSLSLWSASAAAVAYGVGAALVGSHWRAARFGAANTVTLIRLVGTCWLVALTVEAIAAAGLGVTEQMVLVAVATGCLVLDGLDGRIARARGEVSGFGARFDMETDTLQLVTMSVAVAVLGAAGWWALTLPGLRYGYLAAARVVPALRIPLGYGSRGRKLAAVVGQVSLIVAVAVDLVRPGWAASVCVAVGLAVLMWSFGRDVEWQLRRRRAYAAADLG